MNQQQLKLVRLERRTKSVRSGLRAQPGRPRLSVHRSLKHISAQVIDDVAGRTLVSASTHEKALRSDAGDKKSKTDLSIRVGETIAKRAMEQGVTQVVFDRGRCRFHGRVRALAEAARKAGLKF